ncbi:MAG: KH domain-containing protein [Chloroflexi bacterium]|nr:KH domain-containing protein [Chloroflexota bacterium]
MKELVEFIAKSLVEYPEQVEVKELATANSVIYELHVAKEDMGRVIGKEGRVADAIRTILRVAATRRGKRVILEIV